MTIKELRDECDFAIGDGYGDLKVVRINDDGKTPIALGGIVAMDGKAWCCDDGPDYEDGTEDTDDGEDEEIWYSCGGLI